MQIIDKEGNYCEIKDCELVVGKAAKCDIVSSLENMQFKITN